MIDFLIGGEYRITNKCILTVFLCHKACFFYAYLFHVLLFFFKEHLFICSMSPNCSLPSLEFSAFQIFNRCLCDAVCTVCYWDTMSDTDSTLGEKKPGKSFY